MRYVLDWVSLVVIMYSEEEEEEEGRAQAHAGLAGAHGSAELERLLPNTLLAADGTFLPFTWPDRNYLNQPRSESHTALCFASSERRGAKASPSALFCFH